MGGVTGCGWGWGGATGCGWGGVTGCGDCGRLLVTGVVGGTPGAGLGAEGVAVVVPDVSAPAPVESPVSALPQPAAVNTRATKLVRTMLVRTMVV